MLQIFPLFSCFLLECHILTGDTVLWVPLSMPLTYVMNNYLDTVVTSATDISNILYMYFFPISIVVVFRSGMSYIDG
jgi:hypothetical protein